MPIWTMSPSLLFFKSNSNKSQSNGTLTLCETSIQIIRDADPQLSIIQSFQCVFGLIAVCPNLLTLYLLLKAKAFHSNLRILLANMSFVLAMYSAAMIVKSFRRLLTPDCELPMLMKACILEEWAFSIPLHNSLVSLFTVCIERLYATLKYRKYDFAEGPPYLAILLLASGWTGTLYVQFANFEAIPDHLWVPICETPLFGSPRSVLSTMISFVVLELLALSTTTFVYIYNRFILSRMVINRAKFDLSSRFLVDQNVKLSSALFPSDLLHVVSYLPTYTLLIIAVLEVSVPISTRVWFLHSTYLYRIMYSAAHPILLITRNPTMKQHARETGFGRFFIWLWAQCKWCKNGSKGRKHPSAEHFIQLEELWSTSYAKHEKVHQKKP